MINNILGISMCSYNMIGWIGCFIQANSGLFFWFTTILLLLGILTSIFLFFKVWRSPKKTIPLKIILSVALLILIVGLLRLEIWNLLNADYSPIATKREAYFFEQQKKQVKIPGYVIETAENLIIKRVGKDIFQKDIVLDTERTLGENILKMDVNNAYTEYKIAYHYLPLKILNNSDSDTLFYIDVEDKNSPYYHQASEAKTIIVNNILPDCVVYPKSCEFKLTTDNIKKIASENNFNSDDLEVRWNSWNYQKLVIEVTSCKLNKVMYLDYTNGSVLSFKDKVICGKEGRDWSL